jgi:hypothetical protein
MSDRAYRVLAGEYFFFQLLFFSAIALLLWLSVNDFILKLALTAAVGVPAVFQYLFSHLFSARVRRYRRSVSFRHYVIVKDGAPGAGKTATGLYTAVVMAKKLWREVKYKNWLYSWKLLTWQREPEKYKQELIDYEEIKEAYDYYKTGDCVPCLWTNIPVRVGARYTSILTVNHAAQVDRLAAYTVLFFDEGGSQFRIDDYKNRPIKISNFFRLCRHAGEFRIISTEQDALNIFIDVRRVVGLNDYMLSQSPALMTRPFVLLIVFLPLRWLFCRIDKGSKSFAPLMSFLEKMINYVGFRRFQHIEAGNTEHTVDLKNRVKVFYLPAALNCEYDNRTFRNLYLARNELINKNVWNRLVLDDTEQNRIDFLRETAPPDETELLKIEEAFWRLEELKSKMLKYRKTYAEAYANFDKFLEGYV